VLGAEPMFGRERYALDLSDRETNIRRASSVVVVGRAVSGRMRRGRGSEGGAVKCGPTFDRGVVAVFMRRCDWAWLR
jgi:hypothetical protein